MNKNKRLSGIYLPLLFISIVVPSVLRTVAVMRDLDIGSGYFTGGKALINASGITVFAFLVLLFTYSVAAKGEIHLRASFSTPATYIPVGAVGAALIFFAADAYTRLGALGIPVKELLAVKHIPTIFNLSLTILAVAACVYFVTNAMIVEKSSSSRALFGICAVVFFALYAAFLYFDTALPLNAPNKIVDQMAYLAAAVFFLYEIRISLGRECWNLYVAFGFVASVLTAYSSIPSLVIYFAKGAVISNSIFETALTLSIFIFATSRTVLTLSLDEDRESDLVSLIKEIGGARAAYLADKHAIEKRAYLEVINRFNEVEETHDEPSETAMFAAIPFSEDETVTDEAPSEAKNETAADEAPSEAKDETAADEATSDAKNETVADEAPSEAKDETAAEEAPSEAKDETVTDEATSEAKNETVTDEAPSEAKDETVEDEAPSEAKDETVEDEVPSEAKDETVTDEVPSEAKDETAEDEAPSEAKDETVTDEAPSEAKDETAEVKAKSAGKPRKTTKKTAAKPTEE